MPYKPVAKAAHPDALTLQAFVAGRLQPPVLDEVALHLEICETCASSLNTQSLSNAPLVARMRETQEQADEDETGHHRREPIETDSLPVSSVLVQTLIGNVESSMAGQQQLSGNPRNQLAGHPSLANTALPSVAAIPGYQMLGEIARGGMGVVYAVRDLSLDRELAVKTLIPGRITEDAASRFNAEAKITARLTHPGIPPVHESGTLPDGTPYLAMKLVRGTTFSKQLKDRDNPAMDRDRSVQVFESICQTMAFAHSRKIIHRDLKPHNVMVGEFGEVQVMDWGLAKRLSTDLPTSAIDADPAATAESSSNSASVASTNSLDNNTRVGDVLGTPAYMPPEQASGDIDNVDARADVFSLGAILCEILTGFPPYQGQNSREIWRQALQGNISACAERLAKCDAEPELVTLAKDCLAIRPEDRPQDAGAVVNRLEHYRAGVRQNLERAQADRVAAEVQSIEERKRRRVAVGMLGSLLLLTIGIGAAAFWYQARQSEIRDRHIRLEEDLDRTLQSAEQTLEALHTDLADPVVSTNLSANPIRWDGRLETVQALVQRVDSLLASAERPVGEQLVRRCDSVKANLNIDERDRRTAQRLDDLPFSGELILDGVQLRRLVAKLYLAEFKEAGFDIETDTAAKVASSMHSSRLRWFWIATIDRFAADESISTAQQIRALEISRLADPDPWRDHFRDPAVWTDRAQLETLVRDPEAQHQPPTVIASLARQLVRQGGNAATLLRIALNRHPQNLWLLYALAGASADEVEAVSCLRAAAALRPGDANLYNTLGVKQTAEESIASFKRSIELNPSFCWAYSNLGEALAKRGQTVEAIACLRKVVQLQPELAYAQFRLGQLLQKNGNLPEAIGLYRELAAKWPDDPKVHLRLGQMLFESAQLTEATASFRNAVELFPADEPDRQAAQSRIEQCENLDSIASRLPGILADTEQPATAAEAFAVADYCSKYRKDYANASRCYALAFSMSSDGPGHQPPSLLISAATAAARALTGEGIGAKPATETQTVLRRQVLGWSQAVLSKILNDTTETPAQQVLAISTLRSFENASAFRYLQNEELLSTLPLDERAEWRQFWADVSRSRIAVESRLGTPFVILARDGNVEKRHPSLAQALADTKDGDTIEIRGDGPFDQEILSVADKTLVVRAGLDATPVLRFHGPAASKLQPTEMFWNIHGGSLTLEGLELLVEGDTPGTRYYAIMNIEEGEFLATRCRFRHNGGKETVLGLHFPSASRLLLSSCEFTGTFVAAISVYPQVVSKIEIENCLFTGKMCAFSIESSSPTDRDVEVVLSGNSFVTDSVISWRVRTPLPVSDQPAPSASGFRVISRKNVFAAETNTVAILYFDSRPTMFPDSEIGTELFRNICRWQEEENLHAESIPAMRLDYGKIKAYGDWFEETESSMLAADLPAWERFLEVSETGSRAEWITFQGGSGQNLLEARRLHGPDAFLLHADLVQKLNLKAGQIPPGITAGSVGPGDAYQLWRQSPDYLEWAAAH